MNSNYKDPLDRIEITLDRIAMKMATKEDLAGMEARMVTKEELAEIKDDLAEMEAKMDVMATGMSAMKTELLDAIHNWKRNIRR